MWQELSITHRASNSATPALRGEEPTWRTCLREIQFHEPEASGALRGIEAHRFLVEICSGLHSPLFGETEVFGQFKTFREQNGWHPAWDEFLDAVEEDVRKVRRNHLRDIGSQSYGSLARRNLPPGKPVVLLGGGRLAEDLFPWLEDFQVTVAVRNTAKWEGSVALESLQEQSLDGASWIIAAPLSNEALQSFWAHKKPSLILDFRGEAQLDETPCKYLSLTKLYEELENVRQMHERKRAEALLFTAQLSQIRADRFARSVVYRPYGWEDAHP